MGSQKKKTCHMSEQSPYDCFDRYIICYNSMLLDEDKKKENNRKCISFTLQMQWSSNLDYATAQKGP